MNKVLIRSKSPLTDLIAEVVQQNDCTYLYIISEKKQSIITFCWVKNHIIVGEEYVEHEDMNKGLQPKMYSKYCKNTSNLDCFAAQNLSIVWDKEGVVVGLYNKDELVCVIPYWLDKEKTGYSAFSSATKYDLHALELNEKIYKKYDQRFKEAEQFWGEELSTLWIEYEQHYLSFLKNNYGDAKEYFDISENEYVNSTLSVYEKGGVTYAFTVGLGVFSQPTVEFYYDEYSRYDKMELGFCYKSDANVDAISVYNQIVKAAAIPWKNITFLGKNHTISTSDASLGAACVLVSDEDVKLHNCDFLQQMNINFYWMLPVKEDVYEKLIASDSNYEDVQIAIKNKAMCYNNFNKEKSN